MKCTIPLRGANLTLPRTSFDLKSKSVCLFRTRFNRLLSTSENTSPEVYLERLESINKGVAVLVLNRSAAKNAISIDFLNKFQSSLDEVRFDSNIRVLIIRSLVDRAFCSGADLKERATMSPKQVLHFLSNLRTAFCNLESLPQPTIASIDGAALGGGLEMALCCDMRVAGKNALFGLPETRLAIIPGAGGTQRLSRLIGLSKAKELIFTAKIFSSSKAISLGLLNSTSETEVSYDKALELAREILPQGPVAIRAAKLALDIGFQLDKSSSLEVEQMCYTQVIPTQDRLEGLLAFKEKRTPAYKGC